MQEQQQIITKYNNNQSPFITPVKVHLNYGTEDINIENPYWVSMNNGRLIEQNLEKTGFQLSHHPFPAEISNIYDNKQVEKYYYPSMVSLLKKIYPQGTEYYCMSHQIRPKDEEQAHLVHSDATQEFCKHLENDIVNNYVEKKDQNKYKNKRFVWVNIWRPIIETPVEQGPLAVCDTNSTNNSEKFAINVNFNKYKQNDWDEIIYGIKPNEKHKWYYYPQQTKDECLIFKQYDSQQTNQSKFCFHSAFDDPNCSNDAPTRYSIECRALIFFDEQVEQSNFQQNITQYSYQNISQYKNYNDLQMTIPFRAQINFNIPDPKEFSQKDNNKSSSKWWGCFSSSSSSQQQKMKQQKKWAIIQNGRDINPTIQSHGVQLINLQSKVDFKDKNQIKNIFYPEVQNIVKSLFPKSQYSEINSYELPMPQERFHWASNEGTNEQNKEWSYGLKGNFVFFSLVKPVSKNPILRQPLVFCDRNKINNQDYTEYKYQKYRYNSLQFNEKQNWFYFPKLNENEAILWISYASHEQAPHVFKTLFNDPNTPNDAPQEEQIFLQGYAQL